MSEFPPGTTPAGQSCLHLVAACCCSLLLACTSLPLLLVDTMSMEVSTGCLASKFDPNDKFASVFKMLNRQGAFSMAEKFVPGAEVRASTSSMLRPGLLISTHRLCFLHFA